jgi:hypothetical protein
MIPHRVESENSLSGRTVVEYEHVAPNVDEE